MEKPLFMCAVFYTAVIASAVSFVWAEDAVILDVSPFSANQAGSGLPDSWKPLTFKKIPKLTQYELISDNGTVVVKASSDASASGLTKALKISPHEYPVIRWRWKIENVLKNSDVRRKDGDDYPARVYITFEYDPDKVPLSKKLKYKAGRALFGDIPIAALNYIWDTKTPVGTIIGNAYTDFAQMIVVESGLGKIGQWVEEERNIYEDYKKAFGDEPPLINGVAIMTDTDNTKERAVAYYGDIYFVRAGDN
ncbi:MAG TPA: DUF3047 domain-containing protein [Nitrospira sp.]|nr:DUF3047 domain-containing protein [Nitrospira sp.]